jgi:hypothetical protein
MSRLMYGSTLGQVVRWAGCPRDRGEGFGTRNAEAYPWAAAKAEDDYEN